MASANVNATISHMLDPFFQPGQSGNRFAGAFSLSEAGLGPSSTPTPGSSLGSHPPSRRGTIDSLLSTHSAGSTSTEKGAQSPSSPSFGPGSLNRPLSISSTFSVFSSHRPPEPVHQNALDTLASFSTSSLPSSIASPSSSSGLGGAGVPSQHGHAPGARSGGSLLWGQGGKAGPVAPDPVGGTAVHMIGNDVGDIAEQMVQAAQEFDKLAIGGGEQNNIIGRDGRPMVHTSCPCCSNPLMHEASALHFNCARCQVKTDIRELHVTVVHNPMTPSEVIAMYESWQSSLSIHKAADGSDDVPLTPGGSGGSELENAIVDGIAKRAREVFSDVRALQGSFIKENDGVPSKHQSLQSTSYHHQRHKTLALEALENFYKIARSEKKVALAVIEGIEQLVKAPGTGLIDFDKGKEVHDADYNPKPIRVKQHHSKKEGHKEHRYMWWALILLECPFLQSSSKLQPERRRFILSRFLGLISNLHRLSHHHLVSVYSSHHYPTSKFQTKIELVNSLLSENIAHLPTWAQDGYKKDWTIRAGSRIMALFWAVNTHAHRLPPQTFYNVAIETLDPTILISDYEDWLARTNAQFCFCHYPFLLSAGHKQALLAYERAQLIGARVRDAYSRGILQEGHVTPFFTLRVKRDHLVDESLMAILANEVDMFKALRIEWAGEPDGDPKVAKRQWFSLMAQQLFDPMRGSFVREPDCQFCWFNPTSQSANDFFLAGVVIGLALLNAEGVKLPLPSALYKKLQGQSLTLDDLEQFRPALVALFREMLHYDGSVEERYRRKFAAIYGGGGPSGEFAKVPLVEGGENIPVTNENRKEYVKRLSHHLLTESISPQFEALKQGFDRAMGPSAAMTLLKAEELFEIVNNGV